MKCVKEQKRDTFLNSQKEKHTSFSFDSESKYNVVLSHWFKKIIIYQSGVRKGFVIVGLRIKRTYTSVPQMTNTSHF